MYMNNFNLINENDLKFSVILHYLFFTAASPVDQWYNNQRSMWKCQRLLMVNSKSFLMILWNGHTKVDMITRKTQQHTDHKIFRDTRQSSTDFMQPFWCWSWNVPGKLGQCHGCRCPGSLRRQDISNYGIDYILCRLNESLSFMTKDFKKLQHIEKWWKMPIYYCFPKIKSTRHELVPHSTLQHDTFFIPNKQLTLVRLSIVLAAAAVQSSVTCLI